MTKMTLEMLWAGNEDGPFGDYYEARRTKISEIAAYIADHMRDPQYADAVAATLMSDAESMGRIFGDSVQGELASRYTRSRNPLPFLV